MIVTGISTQGRFGADQWLTSYWLSYSHDGASYTPVPSSDGTVFAGNSDQNTKVNHTLPAAVCARYIQLRARTWYRWVSLRWELYGCRAGECKKFDIVLSSCKKCAVSRVVFINFVTMSMLVRSAICKINSLKYINGTRPTSYVSPVWMFSVNYQQTKSHQQLLQSTHLQLP